jgi:alpha-L-fucosidase
VDDLENLYFSSVGHNGKLLLNVPPTREGLLHSTDVARLTGFHARLTSLFEHDLARDARRTFSATGPHSAELTLDLPRVANVGIARLEEDITHGQNVARYTLYGATDREWKVLSRGSTIGYTKLDRFEPMSGRRLRLVIEDAAARPNGIVIKLYDTHRPGG